MGHECAGVVSEVGEGVVDLKVGDRVGVNPLDPKTREATGYNYDGGYANKVLVPAKQCVKIPNEVSFEEGAASTDAGLTAYHALFAIGQAKPDMKVGIIGVGGLGQFAVQMAMIKGCEVYASDVSEAAIQLAKEKGFKEKYINFLSSGSSKYPLDLLLDLGIDISDTKTLKKAFDLFSEKVNLLKKIESGE